MARGGKGVGAKASMQNVAAYAGVSIATVSKVMKGVATIRPETVVKVQNAIEALGYRINPLAADLRRGRRRVIGAIVQSFDDPLQGALVSALEAEAERRGHALAPMSSRWSQEREVELVNRMDDWRVAGLIAVPSRIARSPATVLLKEVAFPTVLVGQARRALSFDTVSVDYGPAMEDLAHTLARRGHDRVLVVEAERALWVERVAGLVREGLKGTHKVFKVESLDPAPTPEAVRSALQARLDGPNRPTVVVSTSLAVTASVLSQAIARAWILPRDLSLVCLHDGRGLAAGGTGLAIITPDVEAVAARAVELLFRRIDEPAAPLHLTKTIVCCTSEAPDDGADAGLATDRHRPRVIGEVVGGAGARHR